MYGTTHSIEHANDGTGYFTVSLLAYDLEGETIAEKEYGFCQPWTDLDALKNAAQRFHASIG